MTGNISVKDIDSRERKKDMEDKIINIENIEIKELDSLKERYMDVKMPEEQLDKLKRAIEKGKMDKWIIEKSNVRELRQDLLQMRQL